MSGVSTAAEALGAALVEQCELYTSLLSLAGREESAIANGDVAGLTDLTEEKERLLEVLAALETERMTALTTIAAAASVDASALTLSIVAALVPAQQGAELTEVGVDLRMKALALREANERNAVLLRSSRDIIDRWIQYLRVIISNTLTYTAEGSPDGSAANRVIDRSA